MSVNKYREHVFVIPEDRANEQVANGFILQDQIDLRRIQVLPCADGWPGVREKLVAEYVEYLRSNEKGHVVLIVDFDGQYPTRREAFCEVTPDDVADRVFVIGVRDNPEATRQIFGRSFEEIGLSLAADCSTGANEVWGHEHFLHNEPDLIRLKQIVGPFLFRT